MSNRNWKIAVTLGILALQAAAAFADDLHPPPWRGAPNTTFNHWTFDNAINHNDATADQWGNTLGVGPGTISSAGGATGLLTFEGRTNVIRIAPGGWIMFLLPNKQMPPPWKKEIYVQVTSFVDDGDNDVTFEPDPQQPPGVTGSHTGHEDLAGGWDWDRFEFQLDRQPAFEFFRIRNLTTGTDVYIDQVVIDTRCVPEPASLAALGLGILMIASRRRQR
ncbi:MAG: PEP-CTERM sorting domain-containing protein [Armatimonadetes bacterium]|nr:PEP-CTERM sorting domain-containing protein [Armatimonadota bacterium]